MGNFKHTPEPGSVRDQLVAKRRQLGDCGGGVALELCLEGMELMDERSHVLDCENRQLVLAAVAELLGLQLPGPGYSERAERWKKFVSESTLVPSPDWGKPTPGA